MTESGKIFSLIPKIMAEVGFIAKERRPTEGVKYAFRGIDDVYFALQPLFAKHGVFCAPIVLSHEREERQAKSGGLLIYTILRVEFSFFADDSSVFRAITVGEAMDSSDKSCNKAMSAAFKYVMLQLFCIPVDGDNDTENSSPEPLAASGNKSPVTPITASAGLITHKPLHPSPAQIKRMFAMMHSFKIPEELLRHYFTTEFKVESTKDLTLQQYDQACAAMERGLIV